MGNGLSQVWTWSSAYNEKPAERQELPRPIRVELLFFAIVQAAPQAQRVNDEESAPIRYIPGYRGKRTERLLGLRRPELLHQLIDNALCRWRRRRPSRTHVWPRGTNVWRRITSPAQGSTRPRSGEALPAVTLDGGHRPPATAIFAGKAHDRVHPCSLVCLPAGLVSAQAKLVHRRR